MKRLAALGLVFLLAACGKPVPPAPPPPAGLTLSGEKVEVGHWVNAYRFALEGVDCSTVTLRLLHVTESGSSVKSQYVYTRLSARLKGSFSVLEQHGEAFDKPGQILFELRQEIPAGKQSAMSTGMPLIQGPFPNISEQFHQKGSLAQKSEIVVFARCMSNNGSHEFGTGSVEYLKQHAAETKDVIVAVTLEWDL